ncbi:MAG: NAD-dependent epimerase/dehydratase family protein [Alphaproteobacteria bacterium]|nr:NAD-dependent epimerase/dehydratase family protein [Alphaproteobacteria bacterium]
MTVLITGGGGFLGAWIIRRLAARGIDMRVFDRREDRGVVRAIAGDVADQLDWRTGDIAAGSDLSRAAEGCDFAIHLAALLTPDCAENPILSAQVNLIGTLNVFEAAKSAGMRGVAYASSAGVFGPDDGAVPYPTTQYGAFKLACEGSARAYWADARISSVGFRPAIVYGPGRETGQTAGPTLACRAATVGQSYTIGYSGRADMIYVDDVAAVFEAAATRSFEGAHAFSLVGEVADVSEIAAGIRHHVPNAVIDWCGPPLSLHPVIAPSPIGAVLGELPHTPLIDGLGRTVAFYQSGAVT